MTAGSGERKTIIAGDEVQVLKGPVQMLDVRKFIQDEIAPVFALPPRLMGKG